MNFFKKLKSRLLGSVKEDLNSALGGARNDFNAKIESAVMDLIALKTGIRVSNIPEKISELALQNATNRQTIEKFLDQNQLSPADGDPTKRHILRFPTDNNRFVDNWIIFRTKKKNVKLTPFSEGDTLTGQQTFLKKNGITAGDLTEINDIKSSMDDYTIALYFPNNVKDAVTVEYEAKDIGISDIMFGNMMAGEFGEMADDVVPAVQELFAKAARGLDSTRSFQTGVVVNTPKFNTFQGVGFRDHTYTFNLNPYNLKDAEEITAIIHTFKMMMLPMPLAKNRRMQMMPSEFSIDFRGPILGSIEHPQNCFLKSCEVDYSGGKDMSFIEDNANPNQGIALPPDVAGPEIPIPRHYPNGVTMTLTFQEILNLDRRRYTKRVSAYAMGESQDVDSEMADFEKELNADLNALSTQGGQNAIEYNEITQGGFYDQKTYSSREQAEEVLTRLNLAGEYEVRMQTSPGRSDQDFTDADIQRYRDKGYNVVPKYRIFKKGSNI